MEIGDGRVDEVRQIGNVILASGAQRNVPINEVTGLRKQAPSAGALWPPNTPLCPKGWN